MSAQDPETLRRQGESLRALARALVHDAHAAEDLAQDAWIVSLNLKNTGRVYNDRTGLLAGILKNLSRHWLRARGRRAARDERAGKTAAARAHPVPRPEEILAAEETRRRIVNIVLQLEEPARSIILLYFWEGRSIAEIGRTLDAPEETVKTRLRRALDALRAKLDREFAGRGDWVAALAPFLPVAGGTAVNITKGAAMAISTKTAGTTAAALILIVAASFVYLQFQRGEPAPADALKSSAPLAKPLDPSEHDESSTRPAPAGTASRTPVRPPEAASQAARVSGRVLDESLQPVAGATIFTEAAIQQWHFRSLSPTPDHNKPGARTGKDGVFIYTDSAAAPSAPQRERQGRLIAVAPGFAFASFYPRLVEGETTQIGDIILKPGGSVSGNTIDIAGKPLGDVYLLFVTEPITVEMLPFIKYSSYPQVRARLTAAADVAGHFKFEGAPAGPFQIVAIREGFTGAISESIQLPPGGDIDNIQIRMDPFPVELTIQGVVRAPDGSGCESEVILSDHRNTSRFVSQSDGSFVLRATNPGTVNLEYSDLARKYGVTRKFAVATGTQNLTLQLSELVTRKVRITNQFHEKLERASINIIEDKAFNHHLDYSNSPLEPPGEFLLRVPPSEFRVEVRAEGHVDQIFGPWRPDEFPGNPEFILTKLPGIRGRLLYQGRPVPNIKLSFREARSRASAYGFDMKHQRSLGVLDATSDAEGRFVITPGASVRIAWILAEDPAAPAWDESEGRSTEAFAPMEIGPFEYDITKHMDEMVVSLSHGGTIRGRILPPPGRSAAGIQIGISSGNGLVRWAKSDSNGNYIFRTVSPGRHLVRIITISTDSGESASLTEPRTPVEVPWNCEVRENETTTFDFDLRDGFGPRIDGIIQIGNTPFAAARLSAIANFYQHDGNETGAASSAVSDASGRFRLLLPDPGTYQLQIVANLSGGVLLNIDLQREKFDCGENKYSIQIPSGRIEGKLLLKENENPAPVQFIYNQPGRILHGEVPVAANGSFVIDPAPAGQLQLTAGGAASQSCTATVNAGETTKVELTSR